MTKPWFVADPQLLEGIRRDLQLRYPDLRIVDDAAILRARGSFPVVFDSEVLDRYQIEVEFPSDYPRSLPRVRETAGRIPRTVDRHVYPQSGIACLFVEEEWLLEIPGTPSILEFLDGPVRNYFIGQSLVEVGQPWPFGERAHGIEGLLEAYGGWFGTREEATIVRYLDYLSSEEVKGHWPCPCGSGEKVRKCHPSELRTYRERIPRLLAKYALERMRYVRRLTDIQATNRRT